MSAAGPSPQAAVLYGRPDCPLCFVLHRTAARAARRHGVPIIVIDIESDPDLLARYGDQIPVLMLPGGGVIRGRAEGREVEEAFLRARRCIAPCGAATRPGARWWDGLRRLLAATRFRSRRMHR